MLIPPLLITCTIYTCNCQYSATHRLFRPASLLKQLCCMCTHASIRGNDDLSPAFNREYSRVLRAILFCSKPYWSTDAGGPRPLQLDFSPFISKRFVREQVSQFTIVQSEDDELRTPPLRSHGPAATGGSRYHRQRILRIKA